MPHPPRQRLGPLLAERRRAVGRTLVDVAAAAGISHGYLSRVERGKRMPSGAILARLAEALGIDVERFAAEHAPRAIDAEVGVGQAARAEVPERRPAMPAARAAALRRGTTERVE